MNSKVPTVCTFISILTVQQFQGFVDLRAFTVAVMLHVVSSVLPRSLAAFQNFQFVAQKSKTPSKLTGELKKIYNFFYMRNLAAIMMVPPILPCSLALTEIYQMSHEIPYFGRGRKIIKNKNRVTL